MIKSILPILLAFISTYCYAQKDTTLTPIDTFISKIDITEIDGKFQFKPILRPLVQIPGGRAPYYKYLWDFGDGHFSTQPEPTHQYAIPGNYEVSVYAVNNYDYGPKPKRPKRTIHNKTQNTAIASISATPFEQNFFASNGIFQIYKLSDAKPGEDLPLVVGVNTQGKKGKIYILTNEKIAGLDGFKMAYQSQYYNEKIDSISHKNDLNSMWASVKQSTFTKTGSPDYGVKEVSNFTSTQQAINYFKDLYGAYNSLSSYDVNPESNEQQFSLINLDVTEDMLIDTNAIVTLTGVFIPEDGLANVHQVDIPVVKSHDPNKMSVKPARMSYRFQSKNKTLTYKVQFQNDGEGDARHVRLEMYLPPEIKKETFKLKSLYPKCDTCSTAASMGCYTYQIAEDGALIFHFKDIALPGTASKTLTDPDSSKGFILFEVDMQKKKFKNKSFKSYTNIYFDKNPPIKTNISTSRFRQIWSPIITIGSSATFGTPKDNIVKHQFKPGIQLGFGIAPMAPYKKPFWQAEIYTSYYSKESSTDILDQKGTIVIQENGRDVKFEYQRVDSTSNRDYLSVQLPLQIRYNINSFLSIGAGVSLRKDFNTKYSNSKNYYYISAQGTEDNIYTIENTNIDKEDSPIKYNPFIDLNIGRVYMGPALGIRFSYDKNQKNYSGIYGIWRF